MLEALGGAALRTLLLAVALQSLLWLLRVRQPRLLFTAWAMVMAASLAMPLLQHAAPLPLPLPLPTLSAGPVTIPGGLPLLGPAPAPAGSPENGHRATDAPIPVLAVAYLLVGGGLLLRLLLGLALSWRLARRATPVRLGWAQGVRVRISRNITAPVTFAGIVLLPPDATTWCTATRAAVIAHEQAHVRRRDFGVLLASQLHRAVFWFSPLSWWLHRRLASLAELASDDRAVAATGDRPGYAAALLEMGRRPGPLRGLAMAGPAALVHRIERALTRQTQPAATGPLRPIGLASAVLALSTLAAGTRSTPGPREFSLPPISDAGRSDQDSAAVSRPIVVASSGITAAQGAALPSAGPAPLEAKEASSPPRPSLSSAPTTQSPDRRVARAPRPPRDPLRPMPATADRLVLAAAPPRRPSSTQEAPLARPEPAKVGGDGPVRPPGETPSCTGVYVPKLTPAPNGEQLEMIEARYLQAVDGSEALKISLGVRTRVKLTGMDVERASIRATVVTRLPSGSGLLTGTMTGLNGTLSYECRRLKA